MEIYLKFVSADTRCLTILFVDIKAEMLRRCYGNKAPEMKHKKVRFTLQGASSAKLSSHREELEQLSPNSLDVHQHRRHKSSGALDTKTHQ